jgi:hypothetical protein
MGHMVGVTGEPYYNAIMVRNWHAYHVKHDDLRGFRGAVDKIWAWCYDNCEDRWSYEINRNDINLWFKSQSDHVRFALTWS